MIDLKMPIYFAPFRGEDGQLDARWSASTQLSYSDAHDAWGLPSFLCATTPNGTNPQERLCPKSIAVAITKQENAMSNLNWNQEKISALGRVFLRKVLANMKQPDNSTVTFGTTGKKAVVLSNGVRYAIFGGNHKAFPGNLAMEGRFDESNLSEYFSLNELESALERASNV